MRWCSRSAAGDISAVSGGFAAAGAATCGPSAGGDAVQAASTSASTAMPAWASRGFAIAVGPEFLTTASQSVTRRPRAAYSLTIGALYLLPPPRVPPSPAALLD